MSGGGFDLTVLEFVRASGAIFLTAFAIKLMDDFLDLRYDAEIGAPSLAVRLGEATLPYSMLLLAVAGLLEPQLAMGLFFAAYAVGMAFDLDRTLPSGLKGWHEGIAAILIGLLLAGPLLQVWSLVVMAFIQAVDDLLDYSRDAMSGNPNLVRRFGVGELGLAALGLLSVAAMMAPFHTAVAVVAVAAVEAYTWRLATRRGGTGSSSLPRGWSE